MAIEMSLQESVALIDEQFAGVKITSVHFDDDTLTIEARRDRREAAQYFRLTARANHPEISGLAITTEIRNEPWPKTFRELVEERRFS